MYISTIELQIFDTHIYAFLYAPQNLYGYARISEIDKVRYRRSVRQGKMKWRKIGRLRLLQLRAKKLQLLGAMAGEWQM